MPDNRLEQAQKMAHRFNQNGAIDQLTMRKIDTIALATKREEMTSERIKQLRIREHISQAVLATMLNMSSESVQKWEQGKSKPQGAALQLLNIIDKKGLSAVL